MKIKWRPPAGLTPDLSPAQLYIYLCQWRLRPQPAVALVTDWLCGLVFGLYVLQLTASMPIVRGWFALARLLLCMYCMTVRQTFAFWRLVPHDEFLHVIFCCFPWKSALFNNYANWLLNLNGVSSCQQAGDSCKLIWSWSLTSSHCD